ncbi:MAG: esterase [Rhodospirillaceae bacterium]|nr:esterase [Rhodospirillaceae bacterium]
MGEAVYRDYDQEGLDAQYNNRKRFPDYIDRFAAWAEWSVETRKRRKGFLDIPFGDQPTETLDIFPAEQPNAPIYVFVHGGYWYSLDKSDHSYVADGMAPNGVTTVVNNYALAPDHDMDEIVRQNLAAMAWLYRHARDYGADPDRIYVCGHSAGGQLAAMMLVCDWPSFAPDLPAGIIKGVCAISGLFDLEPIQLSYLNKTLKMTPEMAIRNSPIRQSYPVEAPLLVVPGEDESEEYHRQSSAMVAFWEKLGYPAELLVPKGLDHFSLVDSFGDPESPLIQRQLADIRAL